MEHEPLGCTLADHWRGVVWRRLTMCLNPFRTAVPFWGQPTQILSYLSEKRDRGSKRVNFPQAVRIQFIVCFLFLFFSSLCLACRVTTALVEAAQHKVVIPGARVYENNGNNI